MPTYAYTAYISIIPYINLHDIYLINPPLAPQYTYVANHLINSQRPTHLMNPSHLPSQFVFH